MKAIGCPVPLLLLMGLPGVESNDDEKEERTRSAGTAQQGTQLGDPQGDFHPRTITRVPPHAMLHTHKALSLQELHVLRDGHERREHEIGQLLLDEAERTVRVVGGERGDALCHDGHLLRPDLFRA